MLLDVAKLVHPGSMKRIIELADERLRAVSEESWKSELESNGRKVEMLLARLSASPSLLLSTNVYNPAIRDTALDCIAGDFEPALAPDRWALLLQAIRPGSLDKTATEVLNGLKNINPSAAGAESFVLCYRAIADRLPVAEYADVALGLISALLNSQRTEVLEFLEQRARDIAAAFAVANESARGGLEAALSSEEESDDQEVANRASRLRGMFGLSTRAEPQPGAPTEGGDQ